ncbi:hypothetical protein [Paenibacillus turpanensis]|uniref:hypothetical protein n=1 Tax=Paenibacillus turpanensis TaxID=2689078 RepID=UPI001407EFD0|nr:hypothetical protein [Paenibacillus turpanensis]
MTIYFFVMLTVLFIGVIATLIIGHSQENREETPRYMLGSKRNLIIITLIYLLGTGIFLALMFLK